LIDTVQWMNTGFGKRPIGHFQRMEWCVEKVIDETAFDICCLNISGRVRAGLCVCTVGGGGGGLLVCVWM